MTQNLRQTFASQVRAAGRPVDKSTTMGVSAGLFAAVSSTRSPTVGLKQLTPTRRTPGAPLLRRVPHGTRTAQQPLHPASSTKRARPSPNTARTSLVLEEPDAALGNGGLGRLAAASHRAPPLTSRSPVTASSTATACFKQLFDKGFQTEHPDF